MFCHYWYRLLDSRLPGRTFKIVAKKVLVDQLIASPIVISMFFATLGVMRRESLEETMEEIRHKFMRLYKAEWIGCYDYIFQLCKTNKRFISVWPTAQVINFWILPNRYRVLYDNTISLGYDIYTSYVINEPITSTIPVHENKLKINEKSRMLQSWRKLIELK